MSGSLFFVYLQAGPFFGSNDKKIEKMKKRITSVESEVKAVKYQIDSLSQQLERTMAILMAIKEIEGYSNLSRSNQIDKRKKEFLNLFDHKKVYAKIDSLGNRIDSLEKNNAQLSNQFHQISMGNNRKSDSSTSVQFSQAIDHNKKNTELNNSSFDSNHVNKNKSEFIRDIYDNALKLHRKGEHDLAIKEFKKIINAEVKTELADNSQFWIADCYFKQGEYKKAIQEFNQVVEEYPNTNKKDDVLYNLGKCYTAIGEKDTAKKYLQELIENYPDSEFFNLAIKRVNKL